VTFTKTTEMPSCNNGEPNTGDRHVRRFERG